MLAERLIGRIRPYFDRVEVIAYVRAPGPFLASSLQQRVRFGRPPARLDDLWPAYRARFVPWEALADAMHYRFFDPKTFAEGDVVLDFCRQLDLQPHRNAGVNVSDGLLQLALNYVQRRFGPNLAGTPGHMEGRAVLRRVLSRLPVQPFRIDPDRVRGLLDQHAEDLDWMRARLPGFDPAQGLDPRPGVFAISEADDLYEVARRAEPDLMALAPWYEPSSDDPLARIADLMTAIELAGGADHSDIRMRLERIAQDLGPQAGNEALVAAAMDVPFYRLQAGIDFADAAAAAGHYLARGSRAGLDAVPWLSGKAYLLENTDVAERGIPPFLHYVRHGHGERRQIRPSPSRNRPAQ